MTKVLITGANGFIGSVLSKRLLMDGFLVRAAYRNQSNFDSNKIGLVEVGEIDANTDWQIALKDIDVVIHLAARVHVMKESASDPLAEFKKINTAGTLNLANQAAKEGVRRLIFFSTIKVHGEQNDKIYSASDNVNPLDPYALSKWLAEQGLQEIRENSELEIVIIRPPLVYGPKVKGNFLRLMKLVNKGFPAPLANVNNKRSMVGVDNLCDLVKTVLLHEKADGEVFLVSDGRDLSTPELIQYLARSLEKPARLFPFPVSWLYFLAGLFGKKPELERLCGSLQVDIQKNQEILSWQPPYSVEDGIGKTVTDYLEWNKQ
jgi:UDP-glucose 4-epimerase